MERLPPLNPLRAFEAAGRLRSIRKAAEELSVTPGAVSRQVQSLESWLGTPLFRREPREIVLTPEGERYLASIALHFDGIREATQKLTGQKNVEILRVRAYTTFAVKWLIPRLSSFHAENKDTEVRLTTSVEAVDFERENVDGPRPRRSPRVESHDDDEQGREEQPPEGDHASRRQIEPAPHWSDGIR